MPYPDPDRIAQHCPVTDDVGHAFPELEAGRRMSDAQPHHPPGQQPVSERLLRALSAHPDRAADLVQALNGPVTDGASLLDLMNRASGEAVRLLPDVHWAGVTAQFGPDGPFTVGHSDQAVLLIDEHQYEQHDGPCLRAMRTDQAITMSLHEVQVCWPELAATARLVGVQSFAAQPLHVADRAVGSLNLYCATPVTMPDLDPDLLAVLIEYLGRGLTAYAQAQPVATSQTLRAALADRAAMGLAIGVLAERYRCDPRHARQRLYEQARAAGTTPNHYAKQIVTTLDGQ